MSVLRGIPGIQYGFGNASDPTPGLSSSEQLQLPRHRQVHGTQLIWREQDLLEGAEADAIAATRPGVIAGIRTADCVPILLSRKDAKAVAAIHAGWRGTVAQITDRVLEELATKHGPMSGWVASIGPHIQACCYRVGADVIQSARTAFPHLELGKIEPQPGMFAMKVLHLDTLKRHGVGEFEATDECTHCTRELHENGEKNFRFFSFRRDATAGRQWSFIKILP